MQTLHPKSPKRGHDARSVLLVVPRWTTRAPSPTSPVQGTPFRSLRIAGTLLAKGYRVHLLDQDLEERSGTPIPGQLPSKVAALVFWCNELEPLIQTTEALALQKKLREFYPEEPFILGGPLIARLPTQAFWPVEGFDFFLQSQGIHELPLLLRALEAGEGLEAVPGLIREGRQRFEGPPPPRRFRVSPEIYEVYQQLDFSGWIQRGGIFGNDQPTLVSSFTQGCAKGCNFCYWRDFPPAFLDMEKAVSHLERLRRDFGVRQFHLAELDFASNRRRLLAFAKAFGQAIPDGLWFSLVSLVDMAKLNGAEWDQLREGGLAKLEFGTESGSPRVLARMGKRHDAGQTLRVTREAIRRGIHCMHNFVFGIPGEGRDDLDQSLSLIHALMRMDPRRISFTFRFFQPPFGTPLGEEALAHVPGNPRRIDQFLASRIDYGRETLRTMPWISAAHEKRIKTLVYHYLPLASSRIHLPNHRTLYRLLRRLARMRLRHRFFSLPLDRRLYERSIAAPLDNTYTA